MGIKHFKASEHSLETSSAIKFSDNFTMTSIDSKVQSKTGESRLLPSVFVVEKGQPITYKSAGPSALYVIEGEYQLEDLSTPGKVILLTAGDVALSDDGDILKGSTPSKMKGFGISYIPAPSVFKDILSQ